MVNYSDKEKVVNISPTKGGTFSIKIYFYNTKLKNMLIKEINISLPIAESKMAVDKVNDD